MKKNICVHEVLAWKDVGDFFWTITSQHPTPSSSSFFLTFQHPDLMVIRSKKRKEREEEEKMGSSSLHSDLVQIPSDLCERVRTAISFFKIWKKRSRSKAEEWELQDASTSVISVLQLDISMWLRSEPRTSVDLKVRRYDLHLFFYPFVFLFRF